MLYLLCRSCLGCLGNPRRLGDFSAEGWSGKGLDPKGEVFLRPPGWAAPRIEYVVPCSMQSQFPYLWSAPLCSTHWMPIQGNQERTKWAFPAAMATPDSTTGIYPHPPLPRPASPSHNGRVRQPLARSWCVPSRSGNNREHNWDPHPRPDTTRPSPLATGVHPTPGVIPVLFSPSPQASVSPAPMPSSRRGSRTYFTYCCQMKPEDK